MKVKELQKTVNVAWSTESQYPILLAAGTAAQQLDASFSTTSTLDLYALNLQQHGYEMELRASVQSDHRFHKILWGSRQFQPNDSSGIIVGGCDKGTIQIYSAARMLANDKNSLIHSQERHKGPVRAMDFNPFKSNLLATGATESEIYIWDIEKIDTPMQPGTCSQPAEDIQNIAWNKQVQHILASAFSQRCIIWDLRKNEAIIKLTDANPKVRWKTVQWHPDVATQLCLASEDDQAPVIELWDLRFATSPLKVLQNHQRGVLSIAWSMHDSDLLLSCSKDNRILCWNPNSDAPNGEVICELAQTNQWNFDVSWCPRHPGLIVASSFEGHAVVYSLLGGRNYEENKVSDKIVDSFPGMDPFAQPRHQIHTETTAELKKAPKWLKKPFGAKFGFGGKLTIVENEPVDQNSPPNSNRKVFVSQVITNPGLIQRSSELDQTLQSGEFVDYCRAKADATNDEHERKIWSCIGAYFLPNVHDELLLQLGYNVDEMNNKLNRIVPQDIDDLTQGVARLGNAINGNAFDGSAAFDVIAQQEQNRNSPIARTENADFVINTSDDHEGLITQAILANNIEAAVSLCFKSKRYSDAIILSMAGGPELLARTQYRYFAEHAGALKSLINSLVSENWSEVVNNCDVSCWKEIAVGLYVHCINEERSALCELLGDRLLASDDPELRKQAQICYILAGNLNKTIEATNGEIEKTVELATIMLKALQTSGRKEVKVEGRVATIMATYAEMLATEGSYDAALTFLGDFKEPRITELRDRLFMALGYGSQTAQVTPRPSYSSQGRKPSLPSQQWQQPKQPVVNQFVQQPASPYAPQFPVQQQQEPNPSNQMMPPPPSATSNVNPRPSSTGPPSKSKYIIDPSVKSGLSYGVTAPAYPQMNPQTYQPYGQPNSFIPPASLYQGNEYDNNQSMGQTQAYNSPVVKQPAMQHQENTFKAEPQPFGWNDPPKIHSSRASQEKTEFQPQQPIVHPLANVVPQNEPKMMPYDNYYQEPQDMYNQQNYGQIPPPQQFHNPPEMMQPNLNPVQPAQNVQVAHVQQVPVEKPKAPIPDEHVHLKTVLDELRAQCLENARNPQTKRKIDDVSKKLEMLYDCLREHKLSSNTLQTLHQISHMIQNGDYTSGLSLLTMLASGSDFSQIASFLPGIKVLLQSALQLGVYIR